MPHPPSRSRSSHSPSSDFLAQLQGYSLTTAEILYRLPDHPALLQSYVWQDYDMAPKFPKLIGFLDFWKASLDGPLFKITVASTQLVRPAELRLVGAEYRLN
ncbi:MAG: usg protein [Hyphomicrobium aestuarii]|nr:usg protein [Hyphomicrobium aestuarii]